MDKIYTVIGLMSGTSLDGVDIARIKTDGQSFAESIDNAFYPYDEKLRQSVKQSFGLSDRNDPRVIAAEKLITDAHIHAIKDFAQSADLIGFHGQTIFHDPANKLTLQIGDGEALAKETGIDVIYDFRSADVAAGGQGAPLLPLYHQVLAKSAKVELPCAILNIGGVGNVTFIGKDDEIMAFDTGPGNALIDDWMLEQIGKPYDKDGYMAFAGMANQTILKQLLDHPYFAKAVPKSLDRDAFSRKPVNNLSLQDGAATLTMFTVGSIVKSFDHLPEKPQAIYVTGGGRKNKFIMQQLAEQTGVPVKAVEDLGWNGDAMEAEGFAYLAVRSRLGLPLSLPGTTGCPEPLTGGRIAPSKAA
jgi:anhydro-N-acetylmuramic acid kinase